MKLYLIVIIGVFGLFLLFNGCRKKTVVETFESPYELIDEMESLNLLESENQNQIVTAAYEPSPQIEQDFDLEAKQIQTALKEAGFYHGNIDGKIGPKSTQAVKDFQAANDLKVDGVIGNNTKEALRRYLPQ